MMDQARDERINRYNGLDAPSEEECMAASDDFTSRAQEARKLAAGYLCLAIRDEFKAENYAGLHGGPDSNPSSQEFRKLRDDLRAAARSVIPWMKDDEIEAFLTGQVE